MAFSRKSARVAFVVLCLLFGLPVVIAWVLNIVPQFRPELTTTNHGELLRPARPVSVTGLRSLGAEALSEGFFAAAWTLVHLQNGKCGERCQAGLYATRQARLALGKDMQRVQRLLLFTGAPDPKHVELLRKSYPGLRVAAASGPAWRDLQTRAGAGQIMLVDPQAFWMMRYSVDADPSGILKDLKRLLKISKIG